MDRAFPRTAFHAGQEVGRVFVGGQEAEFVFGRGTQILPTLGAEIWGRTASRVVLDSNERWFEMGFRIDGGPQLTGNAAAGWTDPNGYFRIDPEWSANLTTWFSGKFVPAPVPVVDLGGGNFEYWARAVHPADSAVKSGALRAASTTAQNGINGNFTPDSRNNPITALTLNNQVIALPNFPYTMPGAAAQLQADIRAAGWPLATVTASTATEWEILIPGFSSTAFNAENKIWWPIYQNGFDLFGNPTYLDGALFFGSYVNTAGVPIFEKAFGRLRISGGNRYDPYL